MTRFFLRVGSAMLAAATLAACSSGGDSGTGGATGAGGGTGGEGGSAELGKGTTTITFSVANGARKNPGLVDPLKGTVYASLFHKDDVKLTGPVDGAEEQASVTVEGVDVVDVDVSTASWKSEPITEGEYIFLGFFDVDGNGATDHSPDPGDPVTLPLSNVVAIKPDVDTPLEVIFELVYN